jgi:hypothetical protein
MYTQKYVYEQISLHEAHSPYIIEDILKLNVGPMIQPTVLLTLTTQGNIPGSPSHAPAPPCGDMAPPPRVGGIGRTQLGHCARAHMFTDTGHRHRSGTHLKVLSQRFFN